VRREGEWFVVKGQSIIFVLLVPRTCVDVVLPGTSVHMTAMPKCWFSFSHSFQAADVRFNEFSRIEGRETGVLSPECWGTLYQVPVPYSSRVHLFLRLTKLFAWDQPLQHRSYLV
jgi:hypothetical protein